MVAPKLTIAALFIGLAAPAAAQEFLGPLTYAVDGDTFDLLVNGQSVRFRLCGIDAPESNEKGYRASKAAVERYLGKTVRCVQVGSGTPCDGRSRRTNRGRVVAQCFIGDDDIAARLVADNLAVDWPKFSGGYYGKN